MESSIHSEYKYGLYNNGGISYYTPQFFGIVGVHCCDKEPRKELKIASVYSPDFLTGIVYAICRADINQNDQLYVYILDYNNSYFLYQHVNRTPKTMSPITRCSLLFRPLNMSNWFLSTCKPVKNSIDCDDIDKYFGSNEVRIFG
jgi:hypothetical protein